MINIELNPKKTDLNAYEISLCGQTIGKNDMYYGPEFIQGLMHVLSPMRAAKIQKFLAAANYMRNSIADHIKPSLCNVF
jgi:hypothetical protein